MSGSAWAPGSTVTANSANTVIPERQTAAQGQTLITLGLFTYTPNTNSIIVMVNGVVQDSGVDYTETSASSLTFTSGLAAGDRVTVLGLNAIIGTAPTFTFIRPSGSLFLNGFSATPAAIGAGLIADYGNVANTGRIASRDFTAAIYKPLNIDANPLNLNSLNGSPVVVGGTLTATLLSASEIKSPTAGLTLYSAAGIFSGGTITLGDATGLNAVNLNIGLGTVLGVTGATVTVTGQILASSVITAQRAVATAAGGTHAFYMGVSNIVIAWGSGVPTVAAARGSLYIRTDNGANTSLYINRDGGATWAAVTSA